MRPCTEMQAYAAQKFLLTQFDPGAITATIIKTGYDRFALVVRLPDTETGLSFHPMDIFNGASGLDLEVRKQISALIDGSVYTAPPVITFGEFITGGTQVYDDVMTHTRTGLHASNGTVVGGGIVEIPEELDGIAVDLSSSIPEHVIVGFDENTGLEHATFLSFVSLLAGVATIDDAKAVLEDALNSDDAAVQAAAQATLANMTEETVVDDVRFVAAAATLDVLMPDPLDPPDDPDEESTPDGEATPGESEEKTPVKRSRKKKDTAEVA